MPERILRAGILTSEPVNGLTWVEECFYRRLMSVADDFGRFDGRNSVLRANLYPLKLDHVSDSDVGKWKAVCATAGLVRVYFVDSKEFVEIVKFNQRTRGASKWPPPTDSDPPSFAGTSRRIAAECGEPPRSAADCGGLRPYSEAQSEAQSEAKALPAARVCVPAADDGAFSAAWAALSKWSEVSTRFAIAPGHNHEREVQKLLDSIAEQPPIPHGGKAVPQRLMVSLAVERLLADRRDFKRIAYACGCVRNLLDEWAKSGMAADKSGASQADTEALAAQRRIREKEQDRLSEAAVAEDNARRRREAQERKAKQPPRGVV